jgi:hypothetical protein
VKQRLELLQRLCTLDRQAALRFLKIIPCFTISEATLERKVAELQQMLAGTTWMAGQLVACQPTLLGARPASRLPSHQAGTQMHACRPTGAYCCRLPGLGPRQAIIPCCRPAL